MIISFRSPYLAEFSPTEQLALFFAGGGRFREVQQGSGAGNRQSRGTHPGPRQRPLRLDHAAPRAERAALRALLRVTSRSPGIGKK